MPGLITNPGKIWLAVEPVDMRRGIDGLPMVVQQSLEHAPCALEGLTKQPKAFIHQHLCVYYGSINSMKTLAKLDQLKLDADTRMQVMDLVQTLLDQAKQEIHAKELKIQALILELAHLHRIGLAKRMNRCHQSILACLKKHCNLIRRP